MTTEYVIRITEKETDKDIGFWHDLTGAPYIFVVKAKAFQCARNCNAGWPQNKYEVCKLTKLNNPDEE